MLTLEWTVSYNSPPDILTKSSSVLSCDDAALGLPTPVFQPQAIKLCIEEDIDKTLWSGVGMKSSWIEAKTLLTL